MSVQLSVESADELRDALPSSGVFDMTDCFVVIDAPIFENKISEIEQMVTVISSAINVVDFAVASSVTNVSSNYLIDITEAPTDVAEGRKRYRK